MGRNLTFKGGIHPLPKLHHGKLQTERLAIEVMPAPETVSIPCAQHIGAPAVPIVEVGDKVKLGQKIAEASGFVSVPVHASVSGTVKEIAPKPNKAGRDVVNIVIANDFEDTIDPGIAAQGFCWIRDAGRDPGAHQRGGQYRPGRRRVPHPRKALAAGG